MTDIHPLRADSYRRMPWKNGGGETLEVAIAPPGAALDGFEWRVSMATVAIDGPFSTFAGVDRTLTLLEGDGMTLAIDSLPPVRLNAGDAPLSFPAEAATTATLAEGAIVDLNVMTRRDRYAHLVERIGGPQDVSVADRTVLLLFGDGLVIEAEGGGVALGYRDFARVDGPADLHVGQAPDAEALLIRIWPLA